MRGLGPQFRVFADVQLAFTPMPSFRDLVHQARNYELHDKAMEALAPTQAPAAFFAVGRSSFPGGRGGSSQQCGGGHHTGCGQQSGHGHSAGCGSNGKKSYVPKCQICKQLNHYADNYPGRYSQHTPQYAAHLARAFGAQCALSNS